MDIRNDVIIAITLASITTVAATDIVHPVKRSTNISGCMNVKHDRLPVKYFHGVFTVPSELYNYFRYNKKRLYNLLFRSVRETLLAFGYDPKHSIGGKIGAICILHTWTQQMTYHPHACPELVEGCIALYQQVA